MGPSDAACNHHLRSHLPNNLEIIQSNDPALSEYPDSTRRDGIPARRISISKEIIRHFSPSWFAVTMGTGMVAVLLNRLPFNGRWLYWLSVTIFVLNVALFLLASVISAARYIFWPETWRIMKHDAYHSLFLGAVPIGFSTIVNMWVYVCVPEWGHGAAYVGWALWMVNSLLATSITFLLPYTIMTHSEQLPLSKINAAQLMPIASTVIAACTGSIVANVLPNLQHALWTILISYILWGLGLPMAVFILVIYYQRLTLCKLPPREAIVSSFLPLSPLGQAGLAAIQLGKAAEGIFPMTDTLHNPAGPMLYVMGWLVGILLWGFSLCWLAFAVATIVHLKHFPFNMGWWGFTFPLGAFSLITTAIGTELPSKFFKVLGMIIAVAVMILWLIVVAGTIRGAVRGELLYSSCVRKVKLEVGQEAKGKRQTEV